MPFGLSGAPVTFQHMMNQLLVGNVQSALACVDDLVIISRTWKEHLQHLREANLTAKPANCRLTVHKTPYLGYVVGQDTIQPAPGKVRCIQEIAQPKTKREIRSFLGLVSYYWQFIPHVAETAVPLSDCTKKKKASNEVV